jgi:hypothetical protein
VVGVTLKSAASIFRLLGRTDDRYKILYVQPNKPSDLLHLTIGRPARFGHWPDSFPKNGTPFPTVLCDTEPPTAISCPPAWKDRLKILTLNRKDRLLLVE